MTNRDDPYYRIGNDTTSGTPGDCCPHGGAEDCHTGSERHFVHDPRHR